MRAPHALIEVSAPALATLSALTCIVCVACVACVACGSDDPGDCDTDVNVSFGTVLEGEDVVDITIGDVRIERLDGDVQGYREGLVASLLLYSAGLQLSPPCGASEVEVVLDQTQVGVTVTLFEPGSDMAFHTDSSETSTDLEPEVGDYQRWTITWPGDSRARRIIISNVGASGVSTLIKAVTFR